jgi:transposase
VKKLHDAYQTNYLTYDTETDNAIGRVIYEQATTILELLERRKRLEQRLSELTEDSAFAGLLSDATGLGPKTLARLIGEIGDDPHRFTNLRGFLAYAACVPYTEQSGSMQRNRRRRARGNNLHAAFRFWADAAKHHQPGCREFYWKLREEGDFHQTALRKIMTKLARAFWHCTTTGEKWDDDKIWKPARPDLDEWIEKVQAKIKKTQKTPVTAR